MENWTIENFTLIAQAMGKMAGFFWPIIIVGAALMFIEWRKEAKYGTN
jgi:hypothetical protein